MTETEWLECSDAAPMLRFASKSMTRRRRVLFGVACCRRVDAFLDPYSRGLLDAIERSADVPLSAKKRLALSGDAMAYADGLSYRMGTPEGCARWLAASAVWAASGAEAGRAAHEAASAVALAKEDPATFDLGRQGPPRPGYSIERMAQAELMRCLVNPFRRRSRRPAPWRTAEVIAGAEAIHADRAFDHLPMLADALDDAGCTDEPILSHLRSPGPHVRGCWALDLILGKS